MTNWARCWISIIAFQKSYATTCYEQNEMFATLAPLPRSVYHTAPPTTLSDGLCRNRHSLLLNKSEFYKDACVQCYSFLPATFFEEGQLCYRPGDLGALWGWQHESNRTLPKRYDYGQENDIVDIRTTFREEQGITLWTLCCEEAKRCCDKMLENGNVSASHCPRQWDGWQCIEDTLNGTTANVVCPSHIYFYGDPPLEGCPSYATKTCFSNATWNPFTDYVTCGRSDTIKRKIYIHIGSFIVSLVFLVPAVFIFLSYKQLRVPRITMHTNFFLSLIVNAIAFILFKWLIINLNALEEGTSDEENVINAQNPVGCKLALVFTKYTRTCTYMWMLCEAFYLHKLIVTSFAEEKRLVVYYLMGWVFPLIPVSIYSTIRVFWYDEHYEWITNAPMLLSLILNTIFLINIIRGLVTKLRATHSNEPSHFRKAAKATLVLVPLFGVHYLTTIYLPHQGTCGIIALWSYFSSVLDGLQGFVVSISFCYSTTEVQMLLHRTYNRHRLMRDSRGGRSFNSRASASTQILSTTDGGTICNDRNSIRLQLQEPNKSSSYEKTENTCS